MSLFWHKPAVRGRAEHVRSAQVFQTSTCSAIARLGRHLLDAQVSDRTFDLGMPEQQLDGPEIARPPADQGSLCASQ
jgi:hypothetical protein